MPPLVHPQVLCKNTYFYGNNTVKPRYNVLEYNTLLKQTPCDNEQIFRSLEKCMG